MENSQKKQLAIYNEYKHLYSAEEQIIIEASFDNNDAPETLVEIY